MVRGSLFLDKANILLWIKHSVSDNNSDLNGALLVLECNRRGKATAAERKLHFHSKMWLLQGHMGKTALSGRWQFQEEGLDLMLTSTARICLF